MSEYGYIPEAPEQSFGNNKGIFNPKDIYDLTRADKYTNYGQLELIETQTYSGAVANIDFTSIQESTYNVHLLTVNNLGVTASGSSQGLIQFYESGVLETANVYQRAWQYGNVTGSFGESKSTADDTVFSFYTATGDVTSNFYLYIYNAGDSSKYTFVTGTMFKDDVGTPQMQFGSGVLTQASTVDGIRIKDSSGANWTSFDISLYGIKEYS